MTTVFKYKRFMRDGTTEERTAVPSERRKRTGKTAKDRKRKHV